METLHTALLKKQHKVAAAFTAATTNAAKRAKKMAALLRLATTQMYLPQFTLLPGIDTLWCFLELDSSFAVSKRSCGGADLDSESCFLLMAHSDYRPIRSKAHFQAILPLWTRTIV